MRRAKRATAAVLCLFTAFGPSAAAGAVVEFSAPAPVIRAPAALGAPLTILPVSAAASPSLPTLMAPPLLSAPVALSVSVLPAVPAKSFPVISAVQPGGIGALRALSVPAAALDAGRLFDGGRMLAAAKDESPVSGDVVGAGSPKLDPAPKAKRPRSTANRFLRAAAVGVVAASAAPVLWSAIPVTAGLLLFSVAILPVAVAATVLLAARLVRGVYRLVARVKIPAKTAPTRRAVNTIRAIGLAVGLALTVTTVVYQKPLIQAAYTYMESRLPASEQEFKTEISGKYFAEETARALSETEEGRAALDRVRGRDGVPRMPAFIVKESRQSPVPLPDGFFADSAADLLSRTAIGRETLDGLRDRGGVLRMPLFFVTYQDGSVAKYTPPDVVFLSVETIERGGVTIEEFLNDRQAQLDYLKREQAVILHELKHAHQARRAMDSGTWKFLRTNGSRLASAAKTYFFGGENVVKDAPKAAHLPRAAGKAQGVPAAEPDITAAPVYIDAAEIHRMGLTVRQFQNDPQAQKEYILRHRGELARAFKAVPPSKPAAPGVVAPTAVTAPAEPRKFSVQFGMIQEWEYEAYISDHLYTHERLAADPGAEIAEQELRNYDRGLQDFDAFMKSIDDSEIYSANFRSRTPFYNGYLSKMRAGWDAHRVSASVLLARRALALGDRAAAEARLEAARVLAAEKGLPAPAFVIPAR